MSEFVFGGLLFLMGALAGAVMANHNTNQEWDRSIERGWYMCGEQICFINVEKKDVQP